MRKYKKLIIIVSFVLYWILNILNLVINKGRFSTFIFYLALFLPLTIAIIREYDVFALFIIILYEIAECFMNLMGVASSFVEIEDFSIILVITQFITALYAFSMISSAVKHLRNKDNNLSMYVLILGGLRCCFAIVNFIIAKDFSSELFFDLFSNILFIIGITIYIFFFDKKELQVFIKSEEK